MAGLSANVRAYRYSLMKEFMRKHGFDAIAFTGSDWFEWASNHELTDQAFERPFVLIVTADGGSFAVLSELSRNTVTACNQRGEGWVAAYHYYAESRDTASHQWNASQLFDLVEEALRTAGLERARIAMLSEREWFAGAAARLPHMQLGSAGALLRPLRWRKHPEEIAMMRACAAMADRAIDLYRELLHPGCLLEEVDFEVCARLVREAGRRLAGQNFVIKGFRTLCGAESACPGGNGAPSGRALGQNTIGLSILGTRLNGLAVELGRPWIVGRPERRITELLKHSCAAQQAAIDAAVAGRPVSGMHAAAQTVLEAVGLSSHLKLRAGHGIGVIQHDFPVDLPFEDRELHEHEVYAVEPAFYISGVGGFRYADTVLVGASGPEPLTRATRTFADLTIN